MAIIKVTPTGEVITRGGLTSCTCCGGAEQTEVCVEFEDGGMGLQNITLVGSLNAGSFTGVYCGTGQDVVLSWNGVSWVVTYNGVTLSDDGGSATYTVSGDTERLDPILMGIYYEDVVTIITVDVLNFGACSCDCDPDYTSIFADLDDGGVTAIEFVGSLCDGEFFCDADSSYLRWTGCEWGWDTAGFEYSANTPITDICSLGVIGDIFDDGARTITITGAA